MSSHRGVRRIEITERETPAFGGAQFGAVGAYERLHGTVYGALDPEHPLNIGITNLDKVPRSGLVEYQSEFRILKPIAQPRGGGFLIYDVPNRGNQPILPRLNGAPEGGRPQHAGNGFLMRHGFTVVWSGWQGDVPPGNDRLTARFPIVPDVTGIVREEFITEATGLLGDNNIEEVSDDRFIAALVYPLADTAGATLTVRGREADPRITPAGLAWRLVDDHHIEISRPIGYGLDRGEIYEFIYRARDPMVMGIGFAAIRDLVSFLRYEEDGNPLADGIRHALGFGISQSGRVLRDLTWLGFNQDLDGRRVFDGILPVVAGSRRTCINWPFAQAGRYSRQHEDHSYGDDQFPFSYPTLTDPISGRTGGILDRARAQDVCPKVLHLDTESDVWQARASLVATDTNGDDIVMPEEVRIFTVTGVPHAPFRPLTKPAMQLPGNPLGYGAVMRALLVALTEWVEHGTPPPDSRFPSRAAGTLVPLHEARERFPRLPWVAFPTVLNELRLRDHSVEPPVESTRYPVFVQPTDTDGNGLGGIRHPLLDAPLATHAGWALRAAGFAEGELFTVQGSMIPFATTEAERQRNGDPRPSLEGRYPSREAWAKQLAAATERLVAERLLLREDADRLIAAGHESWDVYRVL
jgi:hypothetical protein